ncbi:DCOR-like protein [Mya arenaria]|uniref:ornithine decarboxylase n=1 Tax=Mya arenaria TaxID=6604 RepID=A0ABY7FPW7_MYAAR|nr:DCOR-like protein [Mya arenaria]
MKTYMETTPIELHPFSQSIHSIVEQHVQAANKTGGDDPFIVGDLGDVIYKYRNWLRNLPRVKPFYAVKCNDDSTVLKLLADLGANFDCASKAEIQKVLSLGVPAGRIIYANPCKQASMLRYAAKHGVSMMTFDNEAELHKVKSIYPDAKLVLRILPPSNFKVQCELGIKFGCHPSKALNLLQLARDLDLNVMGIRYMFGKTLVAGLIGRTESY